MSAQRRPDLIVRAARGVASAAHAFAQNVRGDVAGVRAQTTIEATGTGDPTGYVQTSYLRQFGWIGQPGPADIQVCANWYDRSHDIRAAVDLLAENASDITFAVTIDGERNDDHPLAILLRNPNPYLGGRYFWRKVWSLFFLTGEVYLVGERTNIVEAVTSRTQHINELWALPGNWIRPVADNNYIGSYRIWPPIHPEYQFEVPRSEVCDLLTFNPMDPTRGMSPIRALAMSLEMEWEARRANLGIFKNGMISQGAWVAPSAISQEQKEILRQAMSSYFGGGDHAHRQMILPVDLKYERVDFSPADMQFIDLTKLTTQEVAKVYRIPPQMLADTEHSTYNNMTEAKRQLFDEGILPVVYDMADQLNARFAWQWGPNVRVIADTSGIAALRADTKAEAEAVQTWVLSGFDPRWAFKRVTGEEAPDDAVATPGQHAGADATSAPTVGKSVSASHAESVAPGGGVPQPTAVPALARLIARPPTPDEQRRRNIANIDELTAQSAPMVRVALELQMRAVLSALEAVYAQKSLRGLVTKAIVDEAAAMNAPGWVAPEVVPAELMSMVWTEQTASRMRDAIENLSVNAARRALGTYQSYIGINVAQGVSDPVAVAKAKQAAADKVVQINDTTRGLLHDAIQGGLRDGVDFYGMKDRIQDAFLGSGDADGLTAYHNRDENIARTEIGRAYNTAARQAIAGVGMNAEWLCHPKATSRDSHLHLNGLVVPADGLFHLAGKYWIPNPQYDTLPAEEACNCGCTVIATDEPPSPGQENNHRMRGIVGEIDPKTGREIESNAGMVDAAARGAIDPRTGGAQ